MSIHVHHLRGCVPTALAHYLKALGVLRLVANQVDPKARGYWRDESFHLVTVLDRAALLRFFADRYAPTPLVAPWNGGSGFYSQDNQSGITAIRTVKANRFSPYQTAITLATSAVLGRDESPKEEAKQALLGECRRTWRGPALAWLDAVIVIDENLKLSFPSLLGSGGNDGRLDFTNNFMQRLGNLFDMAIDEAPATSSARQLLATALFSDEPHPGLLPDAKIGQFLPGSAGGANSTAGFGGKSLINPWDFVLMLEGAVCFGAALSRRIRGGESSQFTAPFSIQGMAVGYGTAAIGEKTVDGEQWLPLWSQPATFDDLGALIAEGRCQQGRSPVRKPVEMAQAMARHGTARGITAFQRFAFLERNGQANLAIPVGRWQVSSKPHPHQSLADEAAGWIERLEQKSRVDHAPASWRRAARICSEALLGVSRDPQDSRWRTLFHALGAAERTLATTYAQAREAGLRPLPKLSPGWVDKLGNTRAMRIAVAIADQGGQRHGTFDGSDTIRHHWQALDGNVPEHQRFAERADTGVIPDLADPLEWLARLVRLRAVRESPLVPRTHVIGLSDIAAFVRGDSDADAGAVFDLLGPCLALDRSTLGRLTAPRASAQETAEDMGCLATYGLLRLATLPNGLELSDRRVAIPCDHQVTLALCAGSIDRAVNLAVRRLRHARLRPFIERTFGGADQARLLAAALAIPLHHGDAARLALRLTKPSVTDVATINV